MQIFFANLQLLFDNLILRSLESKSLFRVILYSVIKYPNPVTALAGFWEDYNPQTCTTIEHIGTESVLTDVRTPYPFAFYLL